MGRKGDNGDKRGKSAFGLLVALGALLLGLVVALNYNQGHALRETRAKVVEEQAALDLARKRLVELKKFEELSPEIKAKLATYQQVIPSGPQEGTIIINMVQWAENNNMRLTEIRFEQHVQRSGYQEIPIKVTLEGRYHGLLELLQSQQHSPRAIRIDQIKVGQITGANSQIKVEIAASVFYL